MSILKEITKEEFELAAKTAMSVMAKIEKDYFTKSDQGESLRFKPNYYTNYKPKQENKELREFSVNGKKVMAYSRKDAIKRLKHKESEREGMQ